MSNKLVLENKEKENYIILNNKLQIDTKNYQSNKLNNICFKQKKRKSSLSNFPLVNTAFNSNSNTGNLKNTEKFSDINYNSKNNSDSNINNICNNKYMLQNNTNSNTSSNYILNNDSNIVNKYSFDSGFFVSDIISQEEANLAFCHGLEQELESKKDKTLLNIATDSSDLKGDLLVRSCISNWYSLKINAYINPENLLLNTGSCSGIILAASSILKSGDNILIESPTYYNTPTLFTETLLNYNIKVNIIPVSRNYSNNSSSEFNWQLIEDIVIKNNIKAFYLITSNSNPMGTNLSLYDRNRLYNLAHKYKFYVLSDDLYELIYNNENKREIPLYFCNNKTIEIIQNIDAQNNINQLNNNLDLNIIDHNIDEYNLYNNIDSCKKEFNNNYYYKKAINNLILMEHLATFDNNSTSYIISINSFNKIIFPNIKFGFIYCNKHIIDKILKNELIYNNGGIKSTNEFCVKSLIELGFLDKALEFTRNYIQYNVKIANQELSKCKYIKFKSPETGYYILIYLDNKVNYEKLIIKKDEFNINFVHGLNFIPEGFRRFYYKEYNNTVRLSVSNIPSNNIKNACEAFVKLIYECVEDNNNN